MIVSSLPIILTDLFGSAAMIVLSFFSLRLISRIKRNDPNQVIWSYLYWVCISLTLFAVSRSAGHLLRQILFLSGHMEIWRIISPFSGGFNTLVFVVVGSVTLFFKTIWKIYQQMASDQHALQLAHKELVYFNHNLEDQVKSRTSALSRSESKYRRIFEISRDAIIVTDTDGFVLNLNPAGKEILKLPNKDFSAASINFKTFFSKEADWIDLNKLTQEQGFVSTTEVNLVRQDKSPMLSLISSSLDISNEADTPTVHYLVKDIEQRRLIDKQMIQADKLASIGQFSAGIAHEINNPLGVILGYTQYLLRHLPKEVDYIQDLKIIEKHVQNCRSIVSDLLNFARSSKPFKKEADIHQLIDEVLSFIKQHASDGEQVQFIKSYQVNLPRLNVDSKKIRQVLMNLIMNAHHAVEGHGTITLSTRLDREKNLVHIIVKDDGYGIAEENLSKIFDPFFTTKPTNEGTGLGLSVSYGIIKNHGGNIYANSTAGKGSEFTIVLPVEV